VTIASFVSSGTAHGILNGFFFFLFVLWLSLGFWTYKDARRRLEDPLLIGVAVLVAVVIPFVGPFIYMLFRPPEYLEDVRERELEIKAIESRLGGSSLRCGVCGSDVEDDFLVCPVCTTKLRQACTSCGRPLEPSWQVCPYCETPAGIDAPVTLANAPRTPRAPRSTRSRSAG
jgi:RNA polymerase subunit RPABC4/transcription elongation factor Spt4